MFGTHNSMQRAGRRPNEVVIKVVKHAYAGRAWVPARLPYEMRSCMGAI